MHGIILATGALEVNSVLEVDMTQIIKILNHKIIKKVMT
jgi:hypothetical protein